MSSRAAHTIIPFIVGAVLLVAVVAAVSVRAFRQIEAPAEARKQTADLVTRASDLLSALKDAETGARGYAITGDEAFLEPYLAVRATVAARARELRQSTSDSAAHRYLDAVTPLIDAKMEELSAVIDLRRKGDVASVNERVAGGRGKQLMDAIRVEIAGFIQFEGGDLAQHEAAFQASMRRLLAVISIVSVLILLLALAFAYLVYRGTQHRIEHATHLERRELLETRERVNAQLQQANMDLQVSEARLAITLGSIGDGVIATDADGRVTFVNLVAEQLTGRTLADAINRPVDEVFHIVNQETRQPSTIPVKETLAHGTVQGLANHTLLIARDGSERAIADSCAPIRDRGGRVVGSVLVFRDVTEEYAAQQAARDSAALMRTILNTVWDGVVTLQAASGIVETVNPAVNRMFGYAASEVIGQHLGLLIPELGRDQGPGSLESYSAGDGVHPSSLGREVVGRRKDGSLIPLEIAVSEMWIGGERSFTGIVRDITARKQAEESLQKAGALQSAIFNSANFSSIATDAKGVIQIFNVGAERMLGYTAAEVMNKITPADISDPREVIARAEALSLELGTPITPGFEALVFKASRGIEDIYELTYFRKDGSRFPAVVSVTALRDAQNSIIGYLLIGTDNSARKQAEEALQKAGALQSAIFNSANFSSIATDAKGVIQIFNVGAERMLGYTAAEVMNKITPADISDPQEVIARAEALSLELGTPITPGFEALVFKASRGIEDIYELTYFRKDGSRFPAVVSVTALRDAQNSIIGYLLIGTDNSARKQAEEALLKAGALQRAIFNSANFSSIATDAKGVIQIFNVGAERMLGYTAAEVMNKITPADISDPQEVIARAEALSLELGTPITPGFEALVFKASRGIEDIYELTYFRKDGSRFPAVVSVTALRDAQDSIIGYLLIGTDNTARKQAEEALQKAGALQRAIFNSANFSSIATDAKGVIQIFNVGAERMLGYTAAEVMNKITPADISDPQEVIARAKSLSVELGTPITPGFEALVFKASRGIEDIYELTYFRKDGSRFPAVVSVTALRDPQEAIIGYLLIGTDNTARKQVEDERMKLDQRLRDQHFYTRSLLESNIDAIMTTDPRGIITDVNKQTEALTGCTRDELIGAPFRNYFTDSSRAEAGINRVLNEGKVTNYELTARARDGKETVVSYNATTFHDRDRRLQGVVAAARDVTELKRFEQTLQQKNFELEDASRLKSEFLANMSHELRTPLNAIIGFSEVLRDGLMGEMTPQQRGFIGDIFSSGKHLLSLINDILDLSKVEAGKMALDLEPVLVSSLFASGLSVVREKAASSRIRLEMESVADLGSIQADARKVKQIVYNLLSNAVKFTPEGGLVTLRASCVPRAEVGRLSGAWAGRLFPLADNEFTEFLKFSVTDTGIGISPGGLARLFKPFSQLDGGLSRKFEGTGLGLVLVKVLVELHGGALAVESAEGQGACFTVWLPLRQLADEAALVSANAPATSRMAALAGTPVALVVEDDFKAADLIRVQLEAEGFAVLHAASAEAALAMAGQQPLSLITLDIMLPNMDGWEFLARIKEVPELRRIPVVIISIAADRNRGFSLGAAAIMQKPISRRELYESLVDLGLFPLSAGRTLKVLVVDDDPKAVELIAVRIAELSGTILRAYGGREAIEAARQERPDLIVLDLIMPDVSGFDVVEALNADPDTAHIPVLVVTAKRITSEDRAKLNGFVRAIMEKAEFDRGRFTAEVQRALSGRHLVV